MFTVARYLTVCNGPGSLTWGLVAGISLVRAKKTELISVIHAAEGRGVNGDLICLVQFAALSCLAAPGMTLSQWLSILLVGGTGSDLTWARKKIIFDLVIRRQL